MVPVLTAPLARVSTAPTYTYNSTPLRAPIPVLSTGKEMEIKETVPKYLLGMNISYKEEEGELDLSHSSYLTSMLTKFKVTDPPRSVPADPAIKLSKHDCPKQAEGDEVTGIYTKYRSILGSIAH